MKNEFDLQAYIKAEKEFGRCHEQLCKRITEVFNCIGKVLGTTIEYWYFPDAPEGGYGFPGHCDWKNPDATIDIEEYKWKISRYSKCRHWDWARDIDWNQFPVRYLTMSDADIIQELRNDCAIFEAKRLEKQKARVAKNDKQKSLKKQALKKLTTTEKRALGIKQ